MDLLVRRSRAHFGARDGCKEELVEDEEGPHERLERRRAPRRHAALQQPQQAGRRDDGQAEPEAQVHGPPARKGAQPVRHLGRPAAAHVKHGQRHGEHGGTGFGLGVGVGGRVGRVGRVGDGATAVPASGVEPRLLVESGKFSFGAA